MAMSVLQVRLPDGLIENIDKLVDKGDYSSRSDVVRDALRNMVDRKVSLNHMIGILPNTGDSVKEIRALRKKLSKEPFDIDELNKLLD